MESMKRANSHLKYIRPVPECDNKQTTQQEKKTLRSRNYWLWNLEKWKQQKQRHAYVQFPSFR